MKKSWRIQIFSNKKINANVARKSEKLQVLPYHWRWLTGKAKLLYQCLKQIVQRMDGEGGPLPSYKYG